MTLWLKGGHSAHMRWECATIAHKAQSTLHTAKCKVDTVHNTKLTVHSAKWTQCTDQMGSVGFMGHACRGDYCCHTAWTTQSPVITTCWLCYFANGDAEVEHYCCLTTWTTQLSDMCFKIKC